MKCSFISATGACAKQSVAGGSYCIGHSKHSGQVVAYRLSDPDLSESIEHHTRASLYDLSQQLVLMRAMIERRLNLADDDPASQIAAFNFVAVQLAALTKMTETVVKLAKDSGELMEKAAVDSFIDKIIVIISEELSSLPDSTVVVDRIVSRLSQE